MSKVKRIRRKEGDPEKLMIRIPQPPPNTAHKDKTKYNRRKKHKDDPDEKSSI